MPTQSLGAIALLFLVTPSPTAAREKPVLVSESQVGGAITVFESEQLRDLPYVTLEQLLTHDVGLQIASQSLHGRQSFPVVRGNSQAFGSGIVLRVDGQRIDDSFFGSPFVYARYFPVAHIERLVIYRGTAASSVATDAADLVIDITTLKGPSEAGLLIGQSGFTTVALERGGRGHLALAAGDLHLKLWTHALEDEGFRQEIKDAAGKKIATIDPLATLSYGGSLSYMGFFTRLTGSYYGTARGLVYGFKSHVNRARHSHLTLMTGLEGTIFGAPSRLTLQLANGKVNTLGLLIPKGIRPQTLDDPLTEDYVLNEWMGEYKIALRGSTVWPLSESFSLRLGVDSSWAIVERSKQQGTHDPETFEFEHAVTEYGNKAVNLPGGAYRQVLDARLALRYHGETISGVLSLGATQITDHGFLRQEQDFALQPRLSFRWDYAMSGHVWIAGGSAFDTAPWATQHLKNHPLWARQSRTPWESNFQPEFTFQAEVGAKQEIFAPHLHTSLALFTVSNPQLYETRDSEAPCPTGECLPIRIYANVGSPDERTGIEWSFAGRFKPIDFDLFAMHLLLSRSRGVPNFSNSSGGLRTIARFGEHSIGIAASAFDAFSKESWYVIVDARWGYRFAPWGRVTLTVSNVTNSTPGGLPRTMPRGYPARGATVVFQIEIRDEAGIAPVSEESIDHRETSGPTRSSQNSK
ncbi:TonB-dependent receptor plug domain-containing protein [Myxococcota bacterium]